MRILLTTLFFTLSFAELAKPPPKHECNVTANGYVFGLNDREGNYKLKLSPNDTLEFSLCKPLHVNVPAPTATNHANAASHP